eukprot:XP_003974405.1 PREDICTED: gamma-interferon-inducible lysosomal thiol reductase-like isoform X1 [Takifugu rubripes]
MKPWGLLVLSLLLCAERSGASHPKPACRYPPSQWCRSLEIALQCRVQKQCMELTATGPDRSVSPVAVTLYYQSLCPGSRVFISQQLFPTWSMLQDIMTVTLVPYGNTKEVPSAKSPFVCQGGEPECLGNMIEACIVHLTGPSSLQTIYCMEAAADPLTAARPCLQLYAPSVSWSTLDSCVKGGLGHRLMHANAAMTRALSPAHLHVPWVTFNGEYTAERETKAMSSLLQLVCQLYQGVKPAACTGAPVRLDRSFC